MAHKHATFDDYIATFPDDVQVILQLVRSTIHTAVPGAAIDGVGEPVECVACPLFVACAVEVSLGECAVFDEESADVLACS